MLYFRITLVLILSAIPFLYAQCIRPKQGSSSKWSHLFTAIDAHLPSLRNLKTAVVNLLETFCKGMKKNDSFRKFFTLIILLVMIALQFVDFTASADIAETVREHQDNSLPTVHISYVYAPLMSRPYATGMAAVISLAFFSYNTADRILTALHRYNKLFFFVAVSVLLIIFVSPRYSIVAEMLFVILIAAWIYPEKTGEQNPKGGKRIPDEKQNIQMKKVA